MKLFRSPSKALGNLDPEAAATLVAAAADLTLVLDAEGVIRDIAFNSDELAGQMEGERPWLGRRWAETVTEESRPKVEALLRDARTPRRASRWRNLNQLTDSGQVPILFSVIRLDADGRLVAFGRDLRPVSQLQQRLVQAQQSMERDYSRLRHAETRYRLLFQTSTEAVLVLDAATGSIVEANEAARRLLGGDPDRWAGRPFLDLFAPEGREAVQFLLATVRAAGRADDVRGRLAEGGREATVSASLFRQDAASLFLVRIATETPDGAAILLPKVQGKLLKVVESAPDAFVVTGQDGRILIANAAFLDLAQLPGAEQARGEPLDRWLGRPGGVDFDVMSATLGTRGSLRLFATAVRGEHGAAVPVEVSAVAVMNGGRPCFGFAIRDVGPRLPADRPAQPGARGAMPRPVEQLTELIGRVPLKDLVREATDVIERLCIEAALELTGDNRASAAEMLGLSRQSLYVKLRRYGLGDLGPEPGGVA